MSLDPSPRSLSGLVTAGPGAISLLSPSSCLDAFGAGNARAAVRATALARSDVGVDIAGELPKSHPGGVIDGADAALTAWLSSLDGVEVVLDRLPDDAPTGSASKRSVRVHAVLTGIAERENQRAAGRHDVRDAEGRVLERQRADRFFDLRYHLVPIGAPDETHRALSTLLQAVVDHDHLPEEFLPAALVEIGHPIPVELVGHVGTAGADPALVVEVTIPVRPSVEGFLGPPVTELELDMEPPPGAVPNVAGAEPTIEQLLADRRWTTVRRRERIAPRIKGSGIKGSGVEGAD